MGNINEQAETGITMYGTVAFKGSIPPEWVVSVGRIGAFPKGVSKEDKIEVLYANHAAYNEAAQASEFGYGWPIPKNHTCYHGTSSVFVPQIRKGGLVPQARSNYEGFMKSGDGRVYLAVKGANLIYESAALFAVVNHGGYPVIIKIRIPEDQIHRMEADEDVYEVFPDLEDQEDLGKTEDITEPVPSKKRITVSRKGKRKHSEEKLTIVGRVEGV